MMHHIQLCDYARRRRRIIGTRPKKPVPSSAIELGSGVVVTAAAVKLTSSITMPPGVLNPLIVNIVELEVAIACAPVNFWNKKAVEALWRHY